jgi:hypothetical protein
VAVDQGRPEPARPVASVRLVVALEHPVERVRPQLAARSVAVVGRGAAAVAQTHSRR